MDEGKIKSKCGNRNQQKLCYIYENLFNWCKQKIKLEKYVIGVL